MRGEEHHQPLPSAAPLLSDRVDPSPMRAKSVPRLHSLNIHLAKCGGDEQEEKAGRKRGGQ